MKNLCVLLFFAPILLISCAKPLALSINYSEDATAKGKVEFVPSKSLSGTDLTVNGKLLVEKQRVKRITLNNVPDGTYNYHLACDNSNYAEKVDTKGQFFVNNGNEQAVLVETPPHSDGYWINMGLQSLGTSILLGFIFYFY